MGVKEVVWIRHKYHSLFHCLVFVYQGIKGETPRCDLINRRPCVQL